MNSLEREERELLEAYEAGELRSVSDKAREIERAREYAKATLKKDRRINIRISSRDLEALQRRAVLEGIPYQTLIASILHKYAAGRLKEASS